MEDNMNNETKGITYQDYREERKKLFEGCKNPSQEIEKEGNEEYHLYMGRAHIKDFSTGKEARGYLKVGRGKFATAIQRGRNQPGVDFRLYAMIKFPTNGATWQCERVFKEIMSEHHVDGPQGQLELYDFKDNEIKQTIETLVKELKRRNISIKEKKLWI